MRVILLIIQREFLVRVKKKSFLIVTLLGPIAMLMMMVVPYWVSSEGVSVSSVLVVDDTGEFSSIQDINSHYVFNYQENKSLVDQRFDAIVYLTQKEGIPQIVIEADRRDVVCNVGVERYLELSKKPKSIIKKVATPCIDDQLIPPEDFETKVSYRKKLPKSFSKHLTVHAYDNCP